MKRDKWNAEHIPDLFGKVIIVTGANAGIGFEASKEFLRHGAETILACRNELKAMEAIRSIKKEIPEARARYLHLDLGNLESVKHFARDFSKLYSKLDILVNNAGIILRPYSLTDDGFESHIGINHLGHFALTGHLFNLIKNTTEARIVNVSSLVYRKGKMDFENLLFEDGRGFSRIKAYGRSKLALLMFTYELDRRIQIAKFNVKAVAVHPGYSYTDFGRRTAASILKYAFYPAVRLITQTQSMGALPTVRAAVDPGVAGADFYGPGGRKEIKGFPVKVQSNGVSYNPEDAAKLWEISEELTGVKYL
jgi:NAD(P)-dependent dehydrogenase (short-subunit alcohol dehydrogenase family)